MKLLTLVLLVTILGAATALNEEVGLQTYLGTISNSMYARPIGDPAKQVDLRMTFFLEKIIKLDGSEQSLTLSGLLFVTWNDSRMRWSPASYGSIQQTHLGVSSIWTPSFYLANGAGEDQMILPNLEQDQVTLRYDGLVYYQKKMKLVVSCNLDVRNFPDDEQYCEVKFSLNGYVDDEIKITVEHYYRSKDFYFTSREWDLSQWGNKVEIVSFDPSKDAAINLKVPQYVYFLRIKRSSYYYRSVLIYPMIMLSFLMVLCFFIPVESGEKISLGITVLLSFTIFILMLDSLLPKTNQLPYLNSYILGLLGLASITLVVSALILRVYHIDHKVQRMGPACFQVIIRGLGSLMLYFGCQTPPKQLVEKKPKKNQVRDSNRWSSDSYVTDSDKEKRKKSRKKRDPEPPKHKRMKIKIQNEWKVAAAILDRFFMVAAILSLVTITVLYLWYFPFSHSSSTVPTT